MRFHPLPAPDDAEVAGVTALVARRVARLLQRRGPGPQPPASSCGVDAR